MTLRELILSVDAEEYSSFPVFQELLKVKPEYGSSRRIEVKLRDGNIAVSNAHVGSLGDIVAYPIDVDSELQISKSSFSMPFSKRFRPTASVSRKKRTSGMT